MSARDHQRFFGSLTAAVFILVAVPAIAAYGKETSAKEKLLAAQSWGYQLAGLELKDLAQSNYDVLVVDYSHNGNHASALSRREVAALKRKPNGDRRIVLSYLSIGEAENYRYYWQKQWQDTPPDWLYSENQRWRGNYRVRFWTDSWKNIIYEARDSYLKRIVDAGFDGVYLDRVDVHSEMRQFNPNARRDMIRFVHELSAKARNLKQGFLVVVQNAEELLESRTYRKTIDGVAKEDLLYGVEGEAQRNETGMINYSVGMLKRARKDNLAVFVVEYLPDLQERTRARTELMEMGFVPHLAGRELENLQVEYLEDEIDTH